AGTAVPQSRRPGRLSPCRHRDFRRGATAHEHRAAGGTCTSRCTMILLHHKPLVTEIDLCAWLSQAAPQDAVEYHRGFLVLDIDPHISCLANGDRLELIAAE